MWLEAVFIIKMASIMFVSDETALQATCQKQSYGGFSGDNWLTANHGAYHRVSSCKSPALWRSKINLEI